jgi:hypothetical protein
MDTADVEVGLDAASRIEDPAGVSSVQASSNGARRTAVLGPS